MLQLDKRFFDIKVKVRYMKKYLGLIFIVMLVTLFSGCDNNTTYAPWPTVDTTISEDGKTATSLGVIDYIDVDNSIVKFYKVDTEELCLYTYNSGTNVLTQSGRVTTIDTLTAGVVVDVEYSTSSFVISKIQVSTGKSIWENSKVTNFKIDDTTRSMQVGNSLYFYKDDLRVYSEGKSIDISELTSADQLIVRGIDNRVLSIVVEVGHGYVTLDGDDIFIGGLIDIGGSIVKVIEENMLILVPEGTHKVEVRNGDTIAEKYVTVVRNEQCVADFSDVAANVTVTGSVKFNINVADATLYIDNVKRDHGSTIVLNEGKHSVIVVADGYVTYTNTIEVVGDHQSLNIYLNEDSEAETEDGNKETTTAAPSTENTTTMEGETIVSKINDVTISGPRGGLVYFDSTYMGVAPVTFDMVTGTHVISILHGTEINSYTVTLAEGGDDVEYDFTPK